MKDRKQEELVERNTIAELTEAELCWVSRTEPGSRPTEAELGEMETPE